MSARTSPTASPGPCRYCTITSYRADGQGPVHECCLAWRHVITAGYQCPSCAAARPVIRQLEDMARRGVIRQVRLPTLPPLPAALPDGTPFVPDPVVRGLADHPAVRAVPERRVA